MILEKTDVLVLPSFAGSYNTSLLSFPQSLLPVKYAVSLLLIASSNLLDSSFMLGVVRIR